MAAIDDIEELIEAHGGEVTLRVTDLLDIFGHYNLSRRDEIASALAERKIEVEPPLERAKRHYTLLLARLGEGRAGGHPPAVTRWALTAGGGVEPWGAAEGVEWVDVEAEGIASTPLNGILGAAGEDAAAVERQLSMRDYRPGVHLASEDGSVRTVSCFAVAYDEDTHEDPTDPDAPKTGRLTFWPLEMAVGPRFLVTIRRTGERLAAHSRAHTRDSNGMVQRCPVLAGHEVQEELRRRWKARAGSGGDAGLHLLQWVIEGHLDALRAVDAWLRQWELQSLHADGPPEKTTLTTLRDMLSELESRIAFFAHPHGDDPVTGWFPAVGDGAQARHVLALVRRAIRQIERMAERVRDHLTAVGAAEDERRSRRVEMVGFLLLFPALIAGVFGANTAIPGAGTWTGFAAMLAAMVLLTALAYLLLTARRKRRARRRAAA